MREKIWKFSYPQRSNNNFFLYIDSANYFPEIIESLKNAQWYIAIEMYLVEPGEMFDRIVTVLLERARANVFVFLVFDYYGSKQIFQMEREKLNHPNIFINFYNKFSLSKFKNNIFRNHRKLIIIDSLIAYTGGTGITDNFYSTSKLNNLWHEVMIKIEGKCVKDWINLFFKDFPRKYKKNPVIASIVKNNIQNKSRPLKGRPQTGRVAYSRRFYFKDILRSTIKQINSAKKEVFIVTAYFLPTWRLRRALKRAVKRGVSVKIILPGESTDHPSVRHMGRLYYYSLLLQGVQIFEYQPAFNHSKVYVCDEWVSIGSCNLDRWSQQRNLEANQEVFDKKFSETVIEMISADIKKSKEIKFSNWKSRPITNRIAENFWISILNLLESLFSKTGK